MSYDDDDDYSNFVSNFKRSVYSRDYVQNRISNYFGDLSICAQRILGDPNYQMFEILDEMENEYITEEFGDSDTELKNLSRDELKERLSEWNDELIDKINRGVHFHWRNCFRANVSLDDTILIIEYFKRVLLCIDAWYMIYYQRLHQDYYWLPEDVLNYVLAVYYFVICRKEELKAKYFIRLDSMDPEI